MVNHFICQIVGYLYLIDICIVLDAESLEWIAGLDLMQDVGFAIDFNDFVLDVYDVLVVVLHPLKCLGLHFLLRAQRRLRSDLPSLFR